IRKLAFAIIHSTTIILPVWYEILEKNEFPIRLMPRDVSTRWNSTFDMLEFAIKHRLLINEITEDRKMDLWKYELSEDEWVIAGQLRDQLKVLKDATLYFSRGSPNLAAVIPAMDHINFVFSSNALNPVYRLSIRAALGIAKRTLNRYYNLTDDSENYRIAMVLHPRYKLQYFK
ncbi:uncharacterized protein STEHIDRAFT_43072, partial [Stereum hirsutum FP-91666 SS1]|uniref:uncharacterized protein n=1 Tax=Stereum hirsutum (strain FP-91666) TaxID=721885 RepID=UPI000440C375